jgi:hypothetical protein
LDPFILKKLAISIGIIVIASLHGFGAAWMAIWMLFHPYKPVKVRGVTVWPQGMIPAPRQAGRIDRHRRRPNWFRSRLCLMLCLNQFLSTKVEDFVAFTNDLPPRSTFHSLRASFTCASANLDTISALQYRLAEYIAAMLKGETAEAIGLRRSPD